MAAANGNDITLEDLAEMVALGFSETAKNIDGAKTELRADMNRLHADMNERLDTVEKRLGSLEGRFDILEDKYRILDTRMSTLETGTAP